MIRIGRVVQNGTSKAVNVPRVVLDALRLTKGDLVILAVEGDRLVMRRLDESVLVSHLAGGMPARAGASKEG